MKTDPILEAMTPLEEIGLTVRSNGYGGYCALGKAINVVFVVDTRDGLIVFEITRDSRPKHQVDIFALIAFFRPKAVEQFLSQQVPPSDVAIIDFCVRNLIGEPIETALNCTDSDWLKLHQLSMQAVKRRTQDFYRYVSGFGAE